MLLEARQRKKTQVPMRHTVDGNQCSNSAGDSVRSRRRLEVRLGTRETKHDRVDDTTSEEKIETNVAGNFKAPSKQSPAQINVSRIFARPQRFTPSTSATSDLESKLLAPSKLLETDRKDETTEGATRPIALEPNRQSCCRLQRRLAKMSRQRLNSYWRGNTRISA